MPRGVVLDRRQILALGTAALLAGWRSPAAAQDTLARLSIILGTAPGATLDAVGRGFGEAAKAVQPNLQVDLQNSEGTMLSVKQCFDARGQADELCFLAGSVFYQSLAGTSSSVTQLSQLGVVGALGSDRRAVFVAASTGITSFADLLASPQRLIVPTPTATSTGQIDALLINALTGSRLKPVPGYASPERKLALLSGEATAAVGSIDTFEDLVEQRVITPVLRINDAGADAPHADLPLLRSFAKGPDADLLVDVIELTASINTFVVAPPGLTDAQLQQLSTLFDTAAAKLQGTPNAAYAAAEILPAGRAEIEKRVGLLRERRQAVDASFARALACGQSLADGTACAAEG